MTKIETEGAGVGSSGVYVSGWALVKSGVDRHMDVPVVLQDD
jgi:hypothetical protein